MLPTQHSGTGCVGLRVVQHVTVQNALQNADNWQVPGYPDTVYYQVQYCLSETAPPDCRLDLSIPILVTVVVCNAIKLLCLTLTLWTGKDPPLMTVGDAAASFLTEADPTTIGRCTVSERDIKRGAWQRTVNYSSPREPPPAAPRRWKSTARSWFRAASRRRWFYCVFLSVHNHKR